MRFGEFRSTPDLTFTDAQERILTAPSSDQSKDVVRPNGVVGLKHRRDMKGLTCLGPGSKPFVSFVTVSKFSEAGPRELVRLATAARELHL